MHKLGQIELQQSKQLMLLLLIMHSGAMIILWLMHLPWIVLVLMNCACIISLIFYWRVHITRSSPKAICKIWPGNEIHSNRWYLQQRNGMIVTGCLLGSSLASNYCIILNFKCLNQFIPIPVIIFADSLNNNIFRLLRADLRLRNKFIP